jgi:O-antigen ligase
MLSAIIVFSQLFFVSKIDFRKKVYITLIFFFSLIAITAVARVYNYDIGKVIDERILERGTNLASARARVTSYEVFIIKFPEHPWFGVGPATGQDVVQLLRGQATIIHIGYLSYLYFYGIFGSVFFFLSLFFLLRNSWLIGKKHMFWGSFYGLLSFCIANATLVYFNLSEMGILLAVIYMKYFTDKSSMELPGYKKPQEITEAAVND